MVAIAAACRATATASENWPLSAQAAASVRRNRGSLPPESCTHVVVRVRLARSNSCGTFEVRDSFVQFIAVNTQVPEVIVGNVVVSGHRKSMGPKGLAVSPVGSLNKCQPCQDSDDCYRDCGSYGKP